ncbi:TetR/AcrR family transcriptional regulator [Microlunatus speluncae]|uniref:TetR/AcrR family transcriptional regulator n=1 Tax=Microlunatus speluncae TaxID=2594267 RepID=UPI0012664A70|nr:TetR/AcrR family transcriptional regulator [Microlunatus speluncae]
MTDEARLAAAVLRAASEAGRTTSSLSLSEIAAAAGISRATLVRRVGGRAEVDALLARHGVPRPDLPDRVITAAAMIIATEGVAALTLERVAGAAGCTVPTVYERLGGRDQVLIAVFRRHAVLPQLAPLLRSTPDGLGPTVRRIYGELLQLGYDDSVVTTALMIDALGRPDSALATHLRDRYLPEANRAVAGFLTELIDAGQLRPLPLPSLLALFFGPVQFCLETGLITGRPEPAELSRLTDDLADAFVRGVGVEPAAGRS